MGTTDIAQRHTTVRIVIGVVLLQAGFSIFHALTWLLRGDIDLHAVLQAYPRAHVALWLAAIAWSLVAGVAMLALRRGVAAGRWIYVGGACLWMLAMFALAPWQLALSGTVLPVMASGILLLPAARRYASDAAATPPDATRRGRLSRVLWALACAWYYAVFFVQLTNTGWLADVSSRVRALLVLAAVLLPVVCVACTRKGQRIWHLGVSLVVSGSAGFLALLGYAPYSRDNVLGADHASYTVSP